MICSISHINKSRLDVQFVRKISLEMVIGQHTKEEGYDQSYEGFLHLAFHSFAT